MPGHDIYDAGLRRGKNCVSRVPARVREVEAFIKIRPRAAMTLDRRAFLLLAAGGALASSLPTTATQATEQSRFKAIAFDAFPIFDPRPIAALTESLFPGKGAAVINVWRTRQFEYQWLRALGGQYADFLHATEASLVFATKQLQLDLTADKRRQLMAAYTNLKVARCGCRPRDAARSGHSAGSAVQYDPPDLATESRAIRSERNVRSDFKHRPDQIV